jgi:hypothetical protein
MAGTPIQTKILIMERLLSLDKGSLVGAVGRKSRQLVVEEGEKMFSEQLPVG